MKKILSIIALSVIFIPLKSFAAMPAGCIADYNFSPINGQRCVDTVPSECAPGDLFSFVTGKACTTNTTVADKATPQIVYVYRDEPEPVVAPVVKGQLFVSGTSSNFQVTLARYQKDSTSITVTAPDGFSKYSEDNQCFDQHSPVTCTANMFYALPANQSGHHDKLPDQLYDFKITVFGEDYSTSLKPGESKIFFTDQK